MTDTLKAERQLYVNITQSGTKDESDSSRTRLLDSELAAVQALRRQLENGLHSTDDIRISIDGRPYFSSNTSGVGSDVHGESSDVVHCLDFIAKFFSDIFENLLCCLHIAYTYIPCWKLLGISRGVGEIYLLQIHL